MSSSSPSMLAVVQPFGRTSDSLWIISDMNYSSRPRKNTWFRPQCVSALKLFVRIFSRSALVDSACEPLISQQAIFHPGCERVKDCVKPVHPAGEKGKLDFLLRSNFLGFLRLTCLGLCFTSCIQRRSHGLESPGIQATLSLVYYADSQCGSYSEA